MGSTNYFASNLKYLRTRRGLEQKDISEMLGLKSPTSVTNWEKGTNLARAGHLADLANFFGVKLHDLIHTDLTSQHQNFLTLITETASKLEKQRQKKVYDFAEEQLAEQSDENNKIIALNEVRELYAQYQTDEEDVEVYGVVSAGTGVEVFEEVVETVKCPSPVPRHDIALKVFGDSMYPLFQHEQIIFVNRTTEVRHGQIGVFVVNGQAFLKKLYKDYSSVKLISLNKDYDNIELTEFDRVDVIGTVIL